MIRTCIVLKNNRELWLNHEIDAIPPELLVDIGDLCNSKLVESDNLNVGKVHEVHAQVVLNSKKIRGVSPIFYSDYTLTFMSVLEKGVKVELILTNAVLKKTIESLDSESIEEFKRLLSKEQLKIYEIKEDIKVAFTVTDKFITLGLFSVKETYDPTKNLVSDHKEAITWGNRLFNHYLKKARKVNLGDLKNC